MSGIDCNVLVAMAFADHPLNAKAIAAVRGEIQAGHQLILFSLIIDEFLHVVTDSRRFDPPLTMNEALDWIGSFRSHPMVKVMEPTPASIDQMLVWMRQFDLGRKRILDTHWAAALYTLGIRRLLTANPSDFSIFGVLEIIVV